MDRASRAAVRHESEPRQRRRAPPGAGMPCHTVARQRDGIAAASEKSLRTPSEARSQVGREAYAGTSRAISMSSPVFIS